MYFRFENSDWTFESIKGRPSELYLSVVFKACCSNCWNMFSSLETTIFELLVINIKSSRKRLESLWNVFGPTSLSLVLRCAPGSEWSELPTSLIPGALAGGRQWAGAETSRLNGWSGEDERVPSCPCSEVSQSPQRLQKQPGYLQKQTNKQTNTLPLPK